MVEEFRVRHVAVQHGNAPCPPFVQGNGIEVDPDDGLAAAQQILGQAAAVIAQTHQDDIHGRQLPHRVGRRLAERLLPLEDFQRTRQQPVKGTGIEDHVGRGKNGQHADQGDQPHDFR